MKKVFCFIMLLAFAGSACFAAEAEKTSKAKDPITATVEVAGKTVVAPVEAVFGGKKKGEEEAKEEVKKETTKKK